MLPERPKIAAPNALMVITAVLGLVAISAWLWVCLCEYLSGDWNAIRLTPTFMWWYGGNPYPGPGETPFTTWIYGPVTLLFFSPAVLAADTFRALLTSFWLNLALIVMPLCAIVCTLGKSDRGLTKFWAVLLAIAAWPSCNLIFEQADNMAIALGLLSLCVFCTPAPPKRTSLWLAAMAGVLALWSKPTELGPVLGQIVWLGLNNGKAAAIRHIMRLAVTGGIFGILFVAAFGAEGIAYNVFVIPSRIPLDNFWSKTTSSLYLPYVIIFVIIPAIWVLLKWRQCLFTKSTAQAACWYFVLSLPFNLTGFATIGGNINSLHGCLFLLPWFALAASRRSLWLPLVLVVILLGLQIQPIRGKPHDPSIARRSLEEAEKLADACTGRIYFPWNPLITFYSEKKFYHSEDGLLTRSLTGEAINRQKLHAGLPADFNFIAYTGGIRRSYMDDLMPASTSYYRFGSWTLVSANGLLPDAATRLPYADSSTRTTP